MAEAAAADLPAEARMPRDLPVGPLADTTARIAAITADLRRAAGMDDTARRLQTMPGIGPITASGLAAMLPDVSAFRSARLGLAPKPQARGGSERPGASLTMGNRSIRRLLYLGALGVIPTRKRIDPGEDRPGEMPRKVVAIALADRMARQIRAMPRTGEARQSA